MEQSAYVVSVDSTTIFKNRLVKFWNNQDQEAYRTGSVHSRYVSIGVDWSYLPGSGRVYLSLKARDPCVCLQHMYIRLCKRRTVSKP